MICGVKVCKNKKIFRDLLEYDNKLYNLLNL